MSLDGWFQEDLTSFDLTVTIPLDQLSEFGVAFRKSSNPSELNFAEVFLDDMKVDVKAFRIFYNIYMHYASNSFTVGNICLVPPELFIVDYTQTSFNSVFTLPT